MFCPKCHTHIIDDSTKFCSRCGESLERKKRKSSFSSTSTFSTLSSSSTFKYSSKYGKKSNADKFNRENIKNEEALDKVLNRTPEECSINEPINTNNHNDQFNYSVKYSGVTKKRQSHDEQFNYSKNYSGVTKKGKTHDEQYNYSQNYSNIPSTTYSQKYNNQPQVMSEDSYRLAFIGPNKESIIKSSFSVPALIFGPLYLVYRKMIGMGILLEIIILFLQANLGNDIATYLQIFIHIILAFKFRTIYLNFVNKKVKEIKNNNQNKTTTEIAYECSQKGKTLGIKEIIKYIVIFYLLSLFASAFYSLDQKSVDEPYNDNTNTPTYNDNYNNNIEEPKFKIGSYGFQSLYDDYIIQTESNDSSIVLEYSPSNTEKCVITVEKIITSDYPYTYLNKQKQYFSSYNSTNVGITNIANNNWYFINLYSLDGVHAATIYATYDYANNEIYTFNVVPYNSYTCNNVAENMMENFKRNY